MQHPLSTYSDSALPLTPVRVAELIKNRKPAIFLYADTPVEESANILRENNILSAPVYDKNEKRFIGLVDVLSLVKYSTLGMFLKKEFNNTFSKAPVKDVVLDNEELEGSILKFVVFHEDDTLETVVSILAQGRVHRGFVRKGLDLNSTEVYPISQSDIVRYLYISKVHLPKTLIRDAISSKKGVICIRDEEPAMDGFMKLWANKVQGLAVVDENGKIVETLSASDVRGMSSEKLEILLLPTPQYKKSLLGKSLPPVCVGMTETMHDATRKLVENKLHRVWVVDDGNHPVSVISLTDLLEAVYHKAVASK
jgi:CBS domain-containing protein